MKKESFLGVQSILILGWIAIYAIGFVNLMGDELNLWAYIFGLVFAVLVASLIRRYTPNDSVTTWWLTHLWAVSLLYLGFSLFRSMFLYES